MLYPTPPAKWIMLFVLYGLYGCQPDGERQGDNTAGQIDCRSAAMPCAQGSLCIIDDGGDWRCRRTSPQNCHTDPAQACPVGYRCLEDAHERWACVRTPTPADPPTQRDGGTPKSDAANPKVPPRDRGIPPEPKPEPKPEPEPEPVDRGPLPVPPPSVLPVDADQRIIAIGDIHGDGNAMVRALTLAGVIDADLEWAGGRTIVVQVGDQLDRGDDEKAILDYFEYLSAAAWQAGGGFYPLIGNHETINVDLDFRYVTEGGWADFADVPADPQDPLIAMYEPHARGRVAAFRPGGPYARILAGHNTVMVIGDTVFVHGGLLPVHLAQGLDGVNASIQNWMAGVGPRPAVISGEDSVVWSRHYSRDTDQMDCDLLTQVLQALQVSRIVVAHSVQANGINRACEGRVIRIDVGLAAHYGGTLQVLQIQRGAVSVIQ